MWAFCRRKEQSACPVGISTDDEPQIEREKGDDYGVSRPLN